jgi:hypothetical protein
MTPDQIEAERARFEALRRDRCDFLNLQRDIHGRYEVPWIESRWRGWLDRAEQAHGAARELPQN